ncbi:EutN/CcmL family microcompartment protein [Dysosmobacter sp.]|jgi:ethanolamine utilization protein EutN|uniref:EutN/CcmL family microcompartment protein n=1 Tax=Dysosmobacter sp. TaxID=2591382 RepID=UPI003D9180CC
MVICKVIGHVWATKKEPALEGLKLMVVQEEESRRKDVHVAADVVGAGIGERVLVVSGSTARKAFGRDDVPADMAIVGIIDSLEINRSAK